MLQDVTDVRPLDGYRLFLRFEDGAAGEVDVSAVVPLDGVCAPLKDPAFFRAVRVAPDLGTIAWPNGADICPDVL
jgi:hypothetical protein